MSNVIGGVVRGQMLYLEKHIAQKKAIYQRYQEGLRDLPVSMNPYDAANSEPNFWLSCLLIDKEAMCKQERTDCQATYISEPGKSCPTEILEALTKLNAEGRPIWKPMHAQPVYCNNAFVSVQEDVGMDIFSRGLCLPSDNKMTPEQQKRIIETIKACFA
jgi:dTDP-4-amino-4,6-dideoxygalactose transaminase